MNEAFEGDYQAVVDADVVTTRFLTDTRIELVGALPRRVMPRHALFDFDGTLSLIREGWPQVMVPMMVDELQATGTDEPVAALQALVETYVMELNGKQTIYQMMRLAEEVARRGGKPRPPQVYKAEYRARLLRRIADRREFLRQSASPEPWLVPGCLEMLKLLRARGVVLHLASGTDEPDVKEEAALLGLTDFFGEHIHGARDNYRTYSKALVIERILEHQSIAGAALIGFGDGFVEIQNIRAAGGLAIAVASDEAERSGQPDAWKRRRLIGAGAHVVIPDFREAGPLTDFLFAPQSV